MTLADGLTKLGTILLMLITKCHRRTAQLRLIRETRYLDSNLEASTYRLPLFLDSLGSFT